MKNKLYRLVNIFISIIFFWIFINTFFKETSTFYQVNGLFSFVSALGIIIIWCIIYALIDKIKNITIKKEIIICVIIFSIIMLLQFLVLYYLRVEPSWDFGIIFDNAKNFVLNGSESYAQTNGTYLDYFPNNIMIFVFYIIIMKIGSIFGITAYTSCLAANVIFINSAILLLYLIVRKKLGMKNAIFSILLCLFFTPLYFYSSVFYSDTFSLFFVMLILYLLTFVDYNKVSKKSIIILVLVGIITFIGKEIKMTVIFVLLAYLLVTLISNKITYTIKIILPIIISFFLCSLLYQNIIIKNPKFDLNTSGVYSIPYTHWIMMGIEDPYVKYDFHNSYGGYKGEDYDLTKIYKTKKEAMNFNLKEIKRRINGYGLLGYSDYLTHKAVNAWGDGLYYSNIKMLFEPKIEESWMREFVKTGGKYWNFTLYFTQGVQIAFLIILIVSSFVEFKNKEYNNTLFILKLIILMIFCFLLLWENRSRYLVNFILIFIYIIMNFYNYIFKIKNKNILINEKKD